MFAGRTRRRGGICRERRAARTGPPRGGGVARMRRPRSGRGRWRTAIYAGGNALRSALLRPTRREGSRRVTRVAEVHFRLHVNRRITLSADSDDLALP
jgi:hypothetical protein